MQQVADWLQKLGLEQYARQFAENDISFSVLPDLTDQDLKEIGVSLGHRRQLLRAIAELKGGEIVALKSVNENIAPAAPQETAERPPMYFATKPPTRCTVSATPSDGDVLGLGRFHGAVGPHGP